MNTTWKYYKTSYGGRKDYYVSDTGLIKSIDRHGNERIYQGTINRATGYRMALGQYVHRLVLQLFQGPCPQDGWYEVDHRDGDKSNNNLSNLAWVSRQENGRNPHKIQQLKLHRRTTSHKGEVIRGERNGEIRYWRNGCVCARDIGASHVLVYNSINKRQSARYCKSWSLRWLPESSVPGNAEVIS